MGKVLDLESLAILLDGHRCVLAHGCFDILHLGHVRYLQSAGAMGSPLVVTVTADRWIRKGLYRPVFRASERADVLAALECVGHVAILDYPTAVEAIRLLRPAVYVKGPEARENKTPGLLAEEQACAEIGCEVRFTAGVVYSSTSLVQHLVR